MIKEAKIHSGKLAQDRANVFQNSGILNSFNSHRSEACIFIGEREEKVEVESGEMVVKSLKHSKWDRKECKKTNKTCFQMTEP